MERITCSECGESYDRKGPSHECFGPVPDRIAALETRVQELEDALENLAVVLGETRELRLFGESESEAAERFRSRFRP
jgi:hypothetical protein